MTQSLYDELILKLLSKEISVQEEEKLSHWVNENEEHKKYLEEVRKVWELTGKAQEKKDFQTFEEWEKFELLLDKQTEGKKTYIFSHSQNSTIPLIYKIAASVILLFIAGIVFYQLKERDELKESGNSRIAFTLGDGTKVWLNQNSTLEFPQEFDALTRSVKLSGEAFFEVRRNPEKPFIITTEGAVVQVLGTSFNVDAYKENKEVEVFVQSGKVKFSSLNREKFLILDPGATGILNKTEKSLTKAWQPNLNSFAWKTGKLTFNRTKLKKVLEDLEDFYKVRFKVKNSELLKRRFTSTFDNTQLQEIIETLSISLNLTISYDNKDYVIDGQGCN